MRLSAALRVALLGVALLTSPALSAPPPVGSEDWEIMAPHAEWIRRLQHGGVLCCTMADGRPVQARITGAGWQVKWRPGQLAGAPLDWTDVPEHVVMRTPNPTGVPIVFWIAGNIRCFIPPSGI